jgi:hypothetical protein
MGSTFLRLIESSRGSPTALRVWVLLPNDWKLGIREFSSSFDETITGINNLVKAVVSRVIIAVRLDMMKYDHFKRSSRRMYVSSNDPSDHSFPLR